MIVIVHSNRNQLYSSLIQQARNGLYSPNARAIWDSPATNTRPVLTSSSLEYCVTYLHLVMARFYQYRTVPMDSAAGRHIEF
jgi:hypothetical protein